MSAALAHTHPCHHSQSDSCSSPSPAAQQSKLVFYLIPLLQAIEVLNITLCSLSVGSFRTTQIAWNTGIHQVEHTLSCGLVLPPEAPLVLHAREIGSIIEWESL